jgi:RNA polymerase sigma-70 factor (ECF subfamily)
MCALLSLALVALVAQVAAAQQAAAPVAELSRALAESQGAAAALAERVEGLGKALAGARSKGDALEATLRGFEDTCRSTSSTAAELKVKVEGLLAAEVRAPLALKVICGLPVPAIARLFVVSEPTMFQRITRAKAKVREAGIAFVAADVPEVALPSAAVPGVPSLKDYVEATAVYLPQVELLEFVSLIL